MFAQLSCDDFKHLVTGQMAVTIINTLEMVKVEHADQQRVAMNLPLANFQGQPLSPGGTIRQTGQRVDKGFFTLFFKVVAIALGLLFHLHHALGQPVQMCRDLLFARVTLLAVLVQRTQ